MSELEPRTPATRSSSDANSVPSASGRRLAKPTLLLTVLGAVSLLGIAGSVALAILSYNLNESVHSSEARGEQLDARVLSLEDDLGRMRDSRDEFKANADDVEVRATLVEEREAAVAAREDAITAKEALIRATTLSDGSYYTVGLSMEAGVYQTNSTSSRCYWSVTRAGTNYSDIVENDIGAIGVLRVTIGDGQDFQSHDCGSWTKVG